MNLRRQTPDAKWSVMSFLLSLVTTMGPSCFPAHAQQAPAHDLLPMLDLYNPRFQGHQGQWARDEASLSLAGPGALKLPFDPQCAYPGRPLEQGKYTLELEIERLGPGMLLLGLPVGAIDGKRSVTVALDRDGRWSGPYFVDGKTLGRHDHGREHGKPMLPLHQGVTVKCEVTPGPKQTGHVMLRVGEVEVFRGDVDAQRMTGTLELSPTVKFAPWSELQLGGTGPLRFTRIVPTGPGIAMSIRDPSRPLAKAPAAPPKIAGTGTVHTPQLPPPIADLATGTWEIKPINQHIRFDWAKLVILFSQRGEVRGAIQWIGTKKERAFEIVHGQIIGERLTLHGVDQQVYLITLDLGRYSGTVSRDGKQFRNVVCVQDGRRVRDANTNERFDARWVSPDVKLLPLTQSAYDAAFAARGDEDEILVHFTDYEFWTKSNNIDFRHTHRADRLVLTRLAQSKNPRVAAAALAMMQGELLRDLKNDGADLSAAVERIESGARSFTGELMSSMIQRDAGLTGADRINDERASRAAAEDAYRKYADNISATFNASFNNEGVKAIQLNEIDRLRLSVLGWDCSQAINQQVRALLRERPVPAAPQAKSWSQRMHLEGGLVQLTLTNTAQAPLRNCVFISEFVVDQDKCQAAWEQQKETLAVADFFIQGLTGVEGDAIDRAHVDAELRFQILAHDTGACLWLPEWKPREQLTIKLAKPQAAAFGRAAGLSIWTDETGLVEQKVPTTQIAAEARKALAPRR